MTTIKTSEITEFHVSNLGSFAPDDLVTTLDGYAQLPGATFDAKRYDFGSDDLSDPLTLAYWRDEWFPFVCETNQRLAERAEAELALWRDHSYEHAGMAQAIEDSDADQAYTRAEVARRARGDFDSNDRVWGDTGSATHGYGYRR